MGCAFDLLLPKAKVARRRLGLVFNGWVVAVTLAQHRGEAIELGRDCLCFDVFIRARSRGDRLQQRLARAVRELGE